jgi:hypothetical protein
MTAFSNRFRMPGKESLGDSNFYFSYNVGSVHIIAFSTDGPVAWGSNSLQYLWLQVIVMCRLALLLFCCLYVLLFCVD